MLPEASTIYLTHTPEKVHFAKYVCHLTDASVRSCYTYSTICAFYGALCEIYGFDFLVYWRNEIEMDAELRKECEMNCYNN